MSSITDTEAMRSDVQAWGDVAAFNKLCAQLVGKGYQANGARRIAWRESKVRNRFSQTSRQRVEAMVGVFGGSVLSIHE